MYYKNLLHGVLTFFSYLLDEISTNKNLTTDHLENLKAFLVDFLELLAKILNFAVEISSANISTVVLDNLANVPQADKRMRVDCRGHFIDQPKPGGTVGSFLDSTALISSMESEDGGIENTLVVSFYLLTREAGLLFQSIGGLMANPTIASHVPRKQLRDLVSTYFYALINLKHMGSVDRISNGLQKMAKVVFDQEDPDLLRIPEELLTKLLQLLSDGKFTNILRRSAGVPFAFSCLLKSEAIKRKPLIDKTMCSLLSISKGSSQNPNELRIHSLNILKYPMRYAGNYSRTPTSNKTLTTMSHRPLSPQLGASPANNGESETPPSCSSRHSPTGPSAQNQPSTSWSSSISALIYCSLSPTRSPNPRRMPQPCTPSCTPLSCCSQDCCPSISRRRPECQSREPPISSSENKNCSPCSHLSAKPATTIITWAES